MQFEKVQSLVRPIGHSLDGYRDAMYFYCVFGEKGSRVGTIQVSEKGSKLKFRFDPDDYNRENRRFSTSLTEIKKAVCEIYE